MLLSHSLKTCTDFYKSPKFMIFTKTLKNLDKKNNEIAASLRNRTIYSNNFHKKFFNSFHKSFIHRKLSSNPKYKEIENRICNTERGEKLLNLEENTKIKTKKSNLKHNLEKIFLTNNYKHGKIKIKKHIKILTESNQNSYKSINIKSNIFLPINIKRFRNNDYQNVIHPKINDFIEDIKMIRTVKFINNIKTEQQLTQNASSGLETEKVDVIMYSLNQSLKLLKSYNSSFTNYNKYLVNKIKREKKILNNYIIDENIVKEQVVLLEKKFDDLLDELEILNNFKKLFIAIKNKTRIKYNKNDKTFSEMYKEKLKQNYLFNKKIASSVSSKEFYKKNSHSKRSKIIRKMKEKEFSGIIKNKNICSSIKKEKIEDDEKSERRKGRYKTILNISPSNKLKNPMKKFERYNSIQPYSSFKKDGNINLNKKKNKAPMVKFEKYDIKKELQSIVNNILENIDKYNSIEQYIIYFKLLFEKKYNSIDILIQNQLIKEDIYNLNFSKNYNILLISKYKILKSQNNDYSLFITIYKKINEMIDLIKDFKVKKYQNLLNNINSIYDKNKILIQYNNEKNRNETLKSYIEKEIINYIFKVFIVIEKLVYELIQGKNNYLSNNYYSEQIEKYENKMDTAKKIFNNRFKRNEEILRRKKINEDAIKKWNKIIFKPYQKVPIKYQIINKKTKKLLVNQENEIENLLFY